MIYRYIDELIHYGLDKRLITESDVVYTRNRMLEFLGLDDYKNIPFEEKRDQQGIMTDILQWSFENGKIESLSATYTDMFDSAIMNLMMPRPSELERDFWEKYEEAPEKATDLFYNLSIDSNYIRMDRVSKNKSWKVDSEYGEIDITINLSKPEKDPVAIEKAKHLKQTGYPKCLLCIENVGYSGRLDHPARQNHRVVPITLNQADWGLQYSPYVYYNEHSIVLSKEHVPMEITKETFRNLTDFVDLFPHYFIGSNADLPLVGGSLLSHDHYQAGRYTFPIENAKSISQFELKQFNKTSFKRISWPLSVIRVASEDKHELIEAVNHIFETWKSYSDESVSITAYTGETRHNTVTPILRKKSGHYEMDVVLRNNRKNEMFPSGIFHPHEEIHPIKKENIGLIEVMGLAVLPKRLVEDMALLKEYLAIGKSVSEIEKDERTSLYSEFYERFIKTCEEKCSDDLDSVLNDMIGNYFVTGLEHCGVYKLDNEGAKAFDRFVEALAE